MDENALVIMSEDEYIAVKQLPIIADRLEELHVKLQAEMDAIRSLVVTDENIQEMKKLRAEWNKKIEALEKLRKRVKAQIEEPYKNFEKGPYSALITEMRDAVGELDGQIKDGETLRKTERQQELLEYYEEYRKSVGVDEKLGDPRRSSIKVGLSGSMKSLKDQAKAHLDKIASDLRTIDTLENRDEIMAEYRISLDLNAAIQAVKDRIEREEAVRKLREEEEAARLAREAHEAEVDAAIAEAAETGAEAQESSADSLSAPSAEKLPEEPQCAQEVYYQAAFRVTGTLDMLRALKQFLVDGGYEFESIKEGE